MLNHSHAFCSLITWNQNNNDTIPNVSNTFRFPCGQCKNFCLNQFILILLETHFFRDLLLSPTFRMQKDIRSNRCLFKRLSSDLTSKLSSWITQNTLRIQKRNGKRFYQTHLLYLKNFSTFESLEAVNCREFMKATRPTRTAIFRVEQIEIVF